MQRKSDGVTERKNHVHGFPIQPTMPIGISPSHHLYEALDYVAKGKVKAVAETYSLKEINKAYERVVEGKVRFRAVITT